MEKITLSQAKKEIKEGRNVICFAEVQLSLYHKTICSTLDELIKAKSNLHNNKISNLAFKSKIRYFKTDN